MPEKNLKIIKNNKKPGRPAGTKNKNKTEINFLLKENNKLRKLNNFLLKENINLKNELSFIKNNKIFKFFKNIFY